MPVALIALVAVLAGPAMATKGGHKGGGSPSSTSTISLNQDPATLQVGSLVTFTTNTAGLSGGEWPMIDVRCSKSGVQVWAAAAAPDYVFKLGGDSSAWASAGGGANCTASLMAYGTKAGMTYQMVVADTTFDVN